LTIARMSQGENISRVKLQELLGHTAFGLSSPLAIAGRSRGALFYVGSLAFKRSFYMR
jgi:hypothetical protein